MKKPKQCSVLYAILYIAVIFTFSALYLCCYEREKHYIAIAIAFTIISLGFQFFMTWLGDMLYIPNLYHGESATVVSDLSPRGIVMIKGEKCNGVSIDGQTIKKGESVFIVKLSKNGYIVSKKRCIENAPTGVSVRPPTS
jgi:membrane-bound ClpP family serine protease